MNKFTLNSIKYEIFHIFAQSKHEYYAKVTCE